MLLRELLDGEAAVLADLVTALGIALLWALLAFLVLVGWRRLWPLGWIGFGLASLAGLLLLVWAAIASSMATAPAMIGIAMAVAVAAGCLALALHQARQTRSNGSGRIPGA